MAQNGWSNNGSRIDASNAPCSDNSSVAFIPCPGSMGFTVKQSSSQVVAYPLFAVADELAGAIGNQEQELQVAYTSPDAMDNGKTVDALVKITPEAP